MYILYYLNDNYQFGTIEVRNLDTPVLIPENLIFINLRNGINFIKEPHECIDFTHLERLIISTEFFDMETIKQSDFRKANTYLTPLCAIEPKVLKIDFSNQTTASVSQIQESVMNRIYSCAGDIGITMHIISTDGIERTYTNLSYLNFRWNNNGYDVEVIEPFEIVKIWFSDNYGDYSNSNTYEVVH